MYYFCIRDFTFKACVIMIKLNIAVLRVLLFTILSATVVSVNAGGILRVEPVLECGKAKAVISFSNFEAKNAVISIEDMDRGIVFYQENIKDVSDFAKVFDLTSLEDGTYVINVNAGNEVFSETVEIIDSELSVLDSKKLLKPVFRVVDDILFVNFQKGSSDFHRIDFYDNTGNFFSDDLGSTTGEKKYSMEKLPKGKYVVSVSGSIGSFTYNFDKD